MLLLCLVKYFGERLGNSLVVGVAAAVPHRPADRSAGVEAMQPPDTSPVPRT